MVSLERTLEMRADPTPEKISDGTMNMALMLHESLSTFSGIAETVRVFHQSNILKNKFLNAR